MSTNNHKFEILEQENALLKDQISSFEIIIAKLRDELNFTINYSQDVKKAISKIHELEDINFDLKSLARQKEHEFKLEKRSIEAKYEQHINKLKSEIQLINHKYDTMMRYELYINKIEEINKELTQRIEKLEKDFTEDLKNEEKKYELKLGLIKQKTLSLLGQSKINIQNNAVKNLNNSYKIILLQVNELHHQLSEQSEMLEEVLKKLTKKESDNQSLRISLKVAQELEKIIISQNKKLSKMIKRLIEEKRLNGEIKEYTTESQNFIHVLNNKVDETQEEKSEITDSISKNLRDRNKNRKINNLNIMRLVDSLKIYKIFPISIFRIFNESVKQ